MSEYDNSNKGSIWKNEKKTTDKHPDFTGSLNVNGVDFWVSAWKRKEGQSQKAPALSFAIKPKEEETPQKRTGGTFSQLDEDIPFNKIGKYL